MCSTRLLPDPLRRVSSLFFVSCGSEFAAVMRYSWHSLDSTLIEIHDCTRLQDFVALICNSVVICFIRHNRFCKHRQTVRKCSFVNKAKCNLLMPKHGLNGLIEVCWSETSSLLAMSNTFCFALLNWSSAIISSDRNICMGTLGDIGGH